MIDTNLQLAWSQTGDYFNVVPENPDFAKWFATHCIELGNDFSSYSLPAVDFSNLIGQLKNNVSDVNLFLKKIKFPCLHIHDDLYCQNNLNSTHKEWISLIRKEPRLDKLLYYTSPELFQKFHDINTLIHKIEKSFTYLLKSLPNWRLDNIFNNKLPTIGFYNVSLNYTDWGKSSWHTFTDGIDDPNNFELSNWNTISADIKINLRKPYRYELEKEYLEYCLKNQVEPTVKEWPLGNISDKDLTHTRHVMDRNSKIPNNTLQVFWK
jgi:hypothetical protein